MKFFFLREALCGLQIIATICRKCICGSPGWGTRDALPNHLVGWERTPLPNPHPTGEKDGIYRFCVRYGLEYTENAFAAGALPRTPLEELTTVPQTPSRLGGEHPQTPSRRFDPRASGSRVCPPHTWFLATPLWHKANIQAQENCWNVSW